MNKEINSNNYSFKILILLKNVENKSFIFPDLNKFNGVFLINNSADKDSMKDFNFWIEELNNISSKNFSKIYVYYHQNNKIIDEDFKQYLETNKIKFYESLKDNLFNDINNLIINQVTNIDKININNNSGSYDSKNKILKSLDPNLYYKTKEDLEKCSFLYENNFTDKIFMLIERLKKFENVEIENFYDLIMFLKSEKRSLEDIIQSLNEITSQNRNAYFAIYYYYSVNRLLNIFGSYKGEKEEKNHENYSKLKQPIPKKENEDKNEDKDNASKKNKDEINQKEEMEKMKNNLLEKQKVIIKELGTLYSPYHNIIKNNNSVEPNKMSNKIDINIGISINIKNKLNDLKALNSKYEHILENLEDFVSNHFNEYLSGLSVLLTSIPETLNYFEDKIMNSEECNKEDIDDFIDFIYLIFNYDWNENFDKISEIADYLEKYFIHIKYKKYDNKTYKIGNYNYEIKDNLLIQISRKNEIIKLENIDNYCLDLINQYKLFKNEYLNQKYLWFFKFRKNNYLEKNKKVFEEFFQNIFQKKSMKELMKKIFPYLRQNYIINEEFISNFFKKIRAYNFRPRKHCGETITATLEIFIKGYFEKTTPPSDICAVASYVIIIFHELAHYTRMYLYNLTGDEIYRKSIGPRENDEIGNYFETLLFGEKSDVINLIQAIYILDEKNYDDTYESFKEGFKQIKTDIENKTAKIKLNNTQSIINKLNLFVSASEKNDFSKKFSIRTGNNYFIIGNMNDKGGRPVDLQKLFAGTAFE